ncbi:MAG: carboxypeptidase-like regulatory domain-containing protein [Acidobacteria bacterium]|nr:carboxypeptidase-like regulatory domain-containing protein [Acidobacteriota bacterium]
MKRAIEMVLIGGLLCCLIGTREAPGQNAFGRLTGRITDPSGALAPNARVRAINVDTGVEASALSNGEGNYNLANLDPGMYRIARHRSCFSGSIPRGVLQFFRSCEFRWPRR